jgi:hypothetical protein
LIAQSSSPEQSITSADSNQTIDLEATRQQYLLACNNTAFSSQFDVFIEGGSALGSYGVYREHVPATVFRPGETIVLYVEPVGFGHEPITDASKDDDNSTTTLYLINMTADYIISDCSSCCCLLQPCDS